jgi:hypothetical protein
MLGSKRSFSSPGKHQAILHEDRHVPNDLLRSWIVVVLRKLYLAVVSSIA